MAAPRTLMEQETIIRWDRAGEEALVWTADPLLAKKLAKKGFELKVMGGGWEVRLPKRCVSIRFPRKKREWTEEERQVVRERLRGGASPAPLFTKEEEVAEV